MLSGCLPSIFPTIAFLLVCSPCPLFILNSGSSVCSHLLFSFLFFLFEFDFSYNESNQSTLHVCVALYSEQSRQHDEGGRVAADLLHLRLWHTLRSHHSSRWCQQHWLQWPEEVHGHYYEHSCSCCQDHWRRGASIWHRCWFPPWEPHRLDDHCHYNSLKIFPMIIWAI